MTAVAVFVDHILAAHVPVSSTAVTVIVCFLQNDEGFCGDIPENTGLATPDWVIAYGRTPDDLKRPAGELCASPFSPSYRSKVR